MRTGKAGTAPQSCTMWAQWDDDGSASPATRWGSAQAIGPGNTMWVVGGAPMNMQPTMKPEAWYMQLPQVPSEPNSWEWKSASNSPGMPPLPGAFVGRWGHSMACITMQGYNDSDCSLVVYGGRDQAGKVLSDMWVKPPGDQTGWQLVESSSSPGGLYGHTAVTAPSSSDKTVSHAHTMLVFGGQGSAKSGTSNVVWRVSLHRNASTTRTSAVWRPLFHNNTAPSPRALHTAVAVPPARGSSCGTCWSMLVYGGCSAPGQSGFECDSKAGLSDLWQLSVGADDSSSSGSATWKRLQEQFPSDSVGVYGHSSIAIQFQATGRHAMLSLAPQSTQGLSNSPAFLWDITDTTWTTADIANCAYPSGRPFKPVLLGGYVDASKRPTVLSFGTAPGVTSSTSSIGSRRDRIPLPGSVWQISVSGSLNDDTCPVGRDAQCGGHGTCLQDEYAPQGAFCYCDDNYVHDDSSNTCVTLGSDFQIYLMYSAFGAAILFFAFMARRVHICCRRRHPDHGLRQPLRGQHGVGGGVATWTASRIDDELITNKEAIGVRVRPECAICFDAESSLLLLPCKHDMCETCACKIFGIAVECPFCRGEVQSARRLVQDLDNGAEFSTVGRGDAERSSQDDDEEALLVATLVAGDSAQNAESVTRTGDAAAALPEDGYVQLGGHADES